MILKPWESLPDYMRVPEVQLYCNKLKNTRRESLKSTNKSEENKVSKTVMILGANVLQIPLIERANERGYNTVVVSPVISEPGHKIATFSEKCDVVDEEGVLYLARK